ncbi:MAG TPA: acetate uptake transporter [Candidatus Baltobacteraceae bacterium]|nr:acetate uptake transporter [Candidatus Baltobacteraceae bacterium]
MQVPPKMANPAALGLAGFALTTFLLSCANAGLLPATDGVWIGFALFYGGSAQLLAGMWEFPQGNTFGATAFSSYGAFWLGTAFYVWFFAGKAASVPQDLAYLLFAWAVFTVYMTIEAVRHTALPVKLVFIVLSITFILLWLGAGFAQPGLTVAGGWTGIVTAVLAWYASWKAAHDAHPSLPV